MVITHVIWDWNGTLLDDVQFGVDLMNGLLKHYGKPLIDGIEGYYRAFSFPIRRYYDAIGFGDDDVFARVSVEWMEAYMKGESVCPLRDTAVEAMKLFEANKIKQVVISASKIENLKKQVEERGLIKRFDALRGLSHIYATSKVDIARKWLTDEGVRANDVVLIGDTAHDFEVAEAIGCRCVLVGGGHQARSTLENCGCAVAGTPYEAARLALDGGKE